MEEAQLPETKAFQDEFTREFMDSSEEVKDGYYLFRSKTDRYTMLFPENAEVSRMFYERNKDFFESLSFVDYSKEENYNFKYDVNFTTYGEEALDNSLEILSEKIGYSGEFQKIEGENTLIYFAENEEIVEGNGNKWTVYGFYSYIILNGEDVGIEYIYSAHCYDEETCNIDPEIEEDKALTLMKSIHFIENE
ncbi:hypothetical protein [Aquibacillus rhizosphaerae]|uniref:Lipoprotein n=1 Tax=Aquibacillus rhizosphaerae TaxID=3051431 RepID=A0ABT7L9U4_9BACI|nr:hypothetical protein [Aquibacillus sp. LR5S19]MDL4842640.1 hypothetical protein [Aquibacillus sp. LR5S19]